MFFQARDFNQNIGSWTVSNVTNMYNMFKDAISFNNGGSDQIKNWSLGKQRINNLFYGATSFNQNINDWDLSNA